MSINPIPFSPNHSSSEQEYTESDSEETIDGDQFEWAQANSKEIQGDFMDWVEDKNFIPPDKMKMNCSQGVAYYVSQRVDNLVNVMRGFIDTQSDREAGKAAVFQYTGSFLGLNWHKDQKGPYDLSL